MLSFINTSLMTPSACPLETIFSISSSVISLSTGFKPESKSEKNWKTKLFRSDRFEAACGCDLANFVWNRGRQHCIRSLWSETSECGFDSWEKQATWVIRSSFDTIELKLQVDPHLGDCSLSFVALFVLLVQSLDVVKSCLNLPAFSGCFAHYPVKLTHNFLDVFFFGYGTRFHFQFFNTADILLDLLQA